VRRIVVLLVLLTGLGVGLIAAGGAGIGPVVITREDEQKIIFFFGDPRAVTEPGLALRVPFVENVRTYSRRLLYINTDPLPIQTRDEERIVVDNYVLWRIEDAVAFRRSFPGGRGKAEAQIDRAVRNDVREVIGRYTLSDVLKEKRVEIMEKITKTTRETLAQYGIAVVDVRINRTELPEGTEQNVFARMKTDRERLARKHRAEGNEQARRIRAEADREARVIVANARRDAEIARGVGDAESTRIYAEAHRQAPAFFAFLRSLEAYRKTIGEGTTLVFSPDAEFFQFLHGRKPAASQGADR
jgi:membrane protease subunit HflC